MEYYPRISDVQRIYEPASWIIEPVQEVSHEDISGLMVCKNILDPTENVAKGMSDSFYGKVLSKLATGTDDEIVALSKKCGLLVSPFYRILRTRQKMDNVFISTDGSSIGDLFTKVVDHQGYPDFNQIVDAIEVMELDEVKSSGIRESALLTIALKESGVELAGTVVSQTEIRATATQLLDALKVIKVIGNEKRFSVSDISKLIDSGGLPPFPIHKLKYIEHCLRYSNLLGIALVLENEKKKKVTDYECDVRSLMLETTEVDALRQQNLLLEIDQARPKELNTFTEAIALEMRNLAMQNKTWAHCDKCGIEFPLTAGKMRKTEHGTYCDKKCRNAAAAKRYRINLAKKKQETDTSAK
ncbi:MAG: hypothetical protein FWE48_05000 [Coriobacteriia bacterium]|nr:hypothetical protein [Coriobacteriia bacterium]